MTRTERDARATQEHEWRTRLMAAAPARDPSEGGRLARGLVHPTAYERAREAADTGRHGSGGWHVLYRVMLMVIEHWCATHPEKARAAIEAVPFDAMIRLHYKEKWGLMRWEIEANGALPRSLTRTIDAMEEVLESASAMICQRCGRPSSVRVPERKGSTFGGWVSTLCDACHATEREEERAREEARWAKAPDPRGDGPASRAQTEVESARHIASLVDDGHGNEQWEYAHDVLEEWRAREGRGTRSAGTYRAHAAARRDPPPSTHGVRLGRWRYEEAEIEVEASRADEAAAQALEADAGWRASEGVGPAFVRSVAGPEGPSLRAALRIEEHHGESAALETALEARREAARAQAETLGGAGA